MDRADVLALLETRYGYPVRLPDGSVLTIDLVADEFGSEAVNLILHAIDSAIESRGGRADGEKSPT